MGFVYAFLWGALWGSFLNVAIYRIPQGLSLVRPGSQCPQCATPIPWYDNVPILAWFWLRGRCRRCKAPFSFRYAAVELLCALLSLGLYHKFVYLGAGPWLADIANYLAFFVFVALLIVLTFIDLDVQWVPVTLTRGGALLGVLFACILDAVTPTQSLAGLVVGYGSLWLVNAFYQRLRGKAGFGGGDLSLLAMIGAFLGLRSLPFVILAASLQGTLTAAALGLWRQLTGKTVGLKSGENLEEPGDDTSWDPMAVAADDAPLMGTALAFVPYLALAGIEWLLIGESVWRAYMAFLLGVGATS